MTGGTHKSDHPDLLGPIRERLERCGVPWVIENVPGAPMRSDIMLCGSMFGLTLRRHRNFETSWRAVVTTRPCDHSGRIVGVYGGMHGETGAWAGWKLKQMLPGNIKSWSKAMGIDWMTARELTQAIPPAYTKFVGKHLMSGLT
jgi:DNA (cytosine-5)-methyltransferase 1